jgi:hypothetical protein
MPTDESERAALEELARYLRDLWSRVTEEMPPFEERHKKIIDLDDRRMRKGCASTYGLNRQKPHSQLGPDSALKLADISAQI